MSNTGVEYVLSLKDQFTSKIKGATNATEKLNGSVSKVQSSFSGLGSALGIGLGVAGVVSFGKSVLDSLTNYEYFSASLRTLMHGDQRAAKALQGDLVQLAAKTPFSLTEVQDASKQLLAYGFNAGSITKNISMLGDVASGLKIPFSDIAYLYGTLKTQGRAYTRDIMQFTSRGIPIIQELAKQFKVTDSAMMKLVTDGKVGFADVEKAFKSMTSEGGQFFGMMDEQSKTVGGQLSNMGDSWEQLKVNIGKSQTGIINSTISMISSLVSSLNRGIAAMNDLDEAFARTGTQDFGWREKYIDPFVQKLNKSVGLGFLNPKENYSDLKSYANNMKEAFVNPNATKEQTLSDIALLNDEIKKLSETGGLFNERKISVLKNVIEKNNDRLALLANGNSTSGVGGVNAGGALSKSGTSTDAVETRGHQNFNISIDKLIEKLEFTTTNLKDSANTIKDEVTKALIGAVNDFQLMATK